MRSTEHAKSPLAAVGTPTQNNLDKFEFGGTALSLAAGTTVTSAQGVHETIQAQGRVSRVAHCMQAALPGTFCYWRGPTR